MCVFVSLVSLFNGISTFVVYLMPKPSTQKHSGGGGYTFPKSLCPKMNVIA